MRMIFLIPTMMTCLGGAALAQYTGPADGEAAQGKYAAAVLADIVANPNDGDHVIVEGMLVRKTGNEMYVLSDGTTEMPVEIDDDDFPATEVSQDTKVRIYGEVDTHLTRDTDIEADRVEVVAD